MLDMSVALFMALVCVLVHFEAVLLIEKILLRIPSARFGLLVSWTGFLLAHVIEIWLYALAYVACGWLGIGELHGATTLLEYAYYSAVVYTTLGFGDIVPGVGIQILTGSQALVGLSLIAWSATHTYARVTSYQAGR